MNRDALNQLRRMAGVPQDFSSVRKAMLPESAAEYSTVGSTTSNPDNLPLPAETDGEPAEHQPEVAFAVGDHVMCGDEECVVVAVDAALGVAAIAPVGKENDISSLKMAEVASLAPVADAGDEHTDSEDVEDVPAEDDSDGVDNGKVDIDMDVEPEDEQNPASVKMTTESQKGRPRDLKLTPSLSKGLDQRKKKALNARERQEGKKETTMSEGMHDYADATYVTHADDPDSPINVASSYETVFTKDQDDSDVETAADVKIFVPAKVLSDLKEVIDQCRDTAEKAEKRDFERFNYYNDTADALQIVHDFINQKTIEGLKMAQVYSQRMANVSRHLMPDHVWKFIVDGGTKRSLKDYVNDVKQLKFPIEGPRNTLK